MKDLKDATIGFIGIGNMGNAIIKGLIDTIPPQSINAFDIDSKKTELMSKNFNINILESIEKLVDTSNIVVLAVKPDTLYSILEKIKRNIRKDTILVSIAAGITLASIEKIIGANTKIVRVMPNTPALVGEGISVLSPNEAIDDHQLGVVIDIFNSIGKAIQLPEKHMDAVTGVSGSGPAYVFTFIQALADGGVKMGIPRDQALMLAAQTVLGSAKLVLESGENPIVLRGQVTSPGGTTIDAVHSLEKAGFGGIIIDAVEQATLKSKRLGEN